MAAGLSLEIAQIVDNQRWLALQTWEVFAARFAAENQDEIDAGVLGQPLVGGQAVADHDHLLAPEALEQRREDDRVGLAEDDLSYNFV